MPYPNNPLAIQSLPDVVRTGISQAFLLNLDTNEQWHFPLAPQSTGHRANVGYAQGALLGVNQQPLIWTSSDGEILEFPNLIIDTEIERKSARAAIDRLVAWSKAVPELGRPPLLSFVFGEQSLTECVIYGEVAWTETKRINGVCVRADLSFSLKKAGRVQPLITVPSIEPIPGTTNSGGIPIPRPDPSPSPVPDPGTPPVDPTPGQGLPGRDLSESDITQFIHPGTILIQNSSQSGKATGWIADESGLIVTNWHVYDFAQTNPRYMLKDGTTGTFTWLGNQQARDTAIGQLPSKTGGYQRLHAARTIASAAKVGDKVFVVGNSKATQSGQNGWDFSDGNITDLNPTENFIDVQAVHTFRSSGDLNDGGDSGSAICNSKGVVVGMVTGSIGSGASEVNVGIKIESIREFYKTTTGKDIPDAVIGQVAPPGGGSGIPQDDAAIDAIGFAAHLRWSGAGGFVIAPGNRGLTAWHMLEPVRATSPGSTWQAQVLDSSGRVTETVTCTLIATEKLIDAAYFSINKTFDKYWTLGNSDNLKEGDLCYAYGTPNGDPLEEKTKGVVVAAGSRTPVEGVARDYVWFGMPDNRNRLLYSGNSGCAICAAVGSERGRIISLTSAGDGDPKKEDVEAGRSNLDPARDRVWGPKINRIIEELGVQT